VGRGTEEPMRECFAVVYGEHTGRKLVRYPFYVSTFWRHANTPWQLGHGCMSRWVWPRYVSLRNGGRVCIAFD